MAKSEVTLTLRISDMKPAKLLFWELMELESDMRVGGSPFADRLSAALERFQRAKEEPEADK